MPEPTAVPPLEPWFGYAAQLPEDRHRLLRRRFDLAKMHGDQDYAVALASAVANYEAVIALVDAGAHDPETLRLARGLYDDGGGWAPS
jgi:hypothetical protein